MTGGHGGRGPSGPGTPIDFAGLAAALLDRAETLVPQWLPGGKRRGAEWVCGDLSGAEGDSLSVNLRTGQWADFASDERGGDLISLYAAIHGLNNGQAARQLMVDLGWQTSAAAPARRVASGHTTPPADEEPVRVFVDPSQLAGDGAASDSAKRRTVWRPIVPVPAFAPEPECVHHHYGRPQRIWLYRFEGERLGAVARYAKSGGGKEIVPWTWCQDDGDARGTQRWHPKQWDEPRPLYVPAGQLGSPDKPVALVEGEKCADALHALAGDAWDVVTWPGGGNAWDKARWGWLMGRTVFLWPDADAKRLKLTREERDAGVDPATKPYLQPHQQPGLRVMLALGAHLRDEQACTVHLCKLPAVGAVADGWDVADAIEQGWTREQVEGFLRAASELRDESASTPSRAAAGGGQGGHGGAGPADADDDRRTWKDWLLRNKEGAIRTVRENLVMALDGLPHRHVPGAVALHGLIAWNQFTNDLVKLRPAPWGEPAGVWGEVEELQLGDWLLHHEWMPSFSRATLEEAVRVVAARHAYHPVREYLEGLRWDGQPRLSTWIRRACLEEDEFDDADPLQQYLAAAGTYFLMGMVARVMHPGCKFDYMLVLESPEQGRGKSTLFRVLAGEWFADTGIVLGDKDSYQQLQGRWLYEWGELDALSKADITKVKQYISSSNDYFRASFDRRAREYPRQVVFGGTTNDDHYLIDSSGNRRFWPVRVTRQVDIAWVRENRDQLFAEALHRLKAGERYHPEPAEEQRLFAPQQEQRRQVGAIEEAIVAHLYDPNQKPGYEGYMGTLTNEISLAELLRRIGFSTDKQTDVVHKRAGSVMRKLGWRQVRSSAPGRPRLYRRPDTEPQGTKPSASEGSGAGASGRESAADPVTSSPRGHDDDPPF